MKRNWDEIPPLRHKPLSAKQEYKLLSKKERQIVDELIVVIKKHKKELGSLRTAECLRKALELVLV